MSERPTVDPRILSQAELDELIDELVRTGQDDSALFHRAHREWERRNGD